MIKFTSAAATIVAVPAYGPEFVKAFGLVIPVMPFGLSLVALLLARSIGKVSRRKLTRMQETAVTILLVLLLLLLVTGQFGGGPMKAGMACIWGIGLGLSGILAIEFVGQVVMTALKTLVGNTVK